MLWFILYIVGALVITFSFFFSTGKDELENVGILAGIAIFWPCWLVLAILASPFVLVAWLGIKLGGRFGV